MPEDEQNDFQRQANNKVKQAQNQATPGPIKNLKDAVKLGDENNVPQKMRDAAEDLEKPNLDKARANQDEALRNLKEMLAALEGQNDDGLDRLRKKQKDLAKADEDVDKLGKRTKEARNNNNPKERAQEMRDLAEEARRNARELARLQEEKASQDLKRAAQLLDNAADKMEQGDQAGAEELEQEAMERIEEARQNLDQFQEELSREQLAKIADRLKGLKERQDAAVQRTQELHKKLTARKEWSRGLMQTLDADRMTQEGLAGETRSLQEKIKEAKVFEHVMDKAAKAMEKAAEAMDKRKDESKGRNFPWNDDDLKDEMRRHEEIAKLQKQAGDRIQRLLDALKEEQVAQEKRDQEQQQPKDGGGDQEQQARPRPADGIPPMAELKALRAEQLEVNERTKELAGRHPNMNDLPDPARRELTELETEQRRLREIFAGMTAKKEGDMP
jgi:DNA repair exonuclease SbcCD ATPase subunit